MNKKYIPGKRLSKEINQLEEFNHILETSTGNIYYDGKWIGHAPTIQTIL